MSAGPQTVPKHWPLVIGLGLSLILAGGSRAADLYRPGSWSALASDRLADRVGDSLTVVISQTSTATNSALSSSRKSTSLAGQVSTNAAFNRSGQLSLSGAFDGSGQTGRSDSMVAEISVVVDALLPNGDLHVSGEQTLNINGEHTRIRLSGRVRRSDISTDNVVQSASLADATIDYNGTGFTNHSAKPGVVNKIFGWLGLL